MILQRSIVTATSSCVAAVVVASPANTFPKSTIVSHLPAASVDAYGQFASGHAINDFTLSTPVDSATLATTSHELDTAHIQPSTIRSDKRFRESELDGDLNKVEAYINSNSSLDSEHIDHNLAAMEVVRDLASTGHHSDELNDGSSIQHLANTKFERTVMGYHNYALVCADSKVHTDYCANGRRGYYCSQNGYVLLQVVS